MSSIVFKSTMPAIAVITKFTTAALLLVALAACNSGGGGGTKKDTSIPLEPTNLDAVGVNKSIDISWNKAKGAISYTVYYHTASFAKDKTSDSLGSITDITKDTKASITGLTDGTKYYLRVEAITASGSHLSDIVEATTKLDILGNLSATGRIKTIDLTWNVVNKATSYTVYYSKASFDDTSDSGVDSTTDITTDTSISITGLADGTKYYFRVIASNPSISSALSQIKSATTKLLTLQPKAAASINRLAAVDLSWDIVAGNVTNYKIYYAKVSLDDLNGGYTNYAPVGGKVETTTDTSTTIGDLSADTTYHFVVATNYNGEEKSALEVTADSSYIAELAMGGRRGCVRLNTGRIKCWGRNSSGQLGVGDQKNKKTATSVSNLRAKQISAGLEHSCAIDLSDRLYCWGLNTNSVLGLSSLELNGGIINYYLSPTLVTQTKLAKNVSLVTAGNDSTCAVADGENYCWGSQEFGGLGNDVDSNDPTKDAQKIKNIPPGVKQFALGVESGCAIDASDDLWCWGRNVNGQVGNDKSGDNAKETRPVNPSLQGSGSKATMLDGGEYHYCVVDNTNKIQCWGSNGKGQLGINSIIKSNSPQYVLASTTKSNDYLDNVSKIATGPTHSCALLITGGRVRCWGNIDYGIIGIDPIGASDRLVADFEMPKINNAIDIAAGSLFTCVLLADKTSVQCWGNNFYGQLGNVATTSDSHTPVAVDGLKEIYQ